MSTVLKSNEALMGEYIKMLVWFISVLMKDIFCPPRDTIRTPAPPSPPPPQRWLTYGCHWRRVFTSDGVGIGVVINQKRRAYDLVKTAFRFRLRVRRLRSAYDLVKTRLSESEAEAKEPNQSQSVGMYIVIGLSFRFCFRLRQSVFH